MEEDDGNSLDNAEYSSKSDFSKAEVVKIQVNKCNEIRSKEMREGYFNYDRFGNKIYIPDRSEEHTSELQSHSFISYAVFCLKKKRTVKRKKP